MSHIVIYEGSAGAAEYRQVDDLDGAVAEVERLRNEDEVEAAEIFELRPVAFEFKPYYRVKLADRPAGAIDLRAELTVTEDIPPEPEKSELQTVPFSRRNLFAR